MRKSQVQMVKYPENRKFKKMLNSGDLLRLAKVSGYARNSLYMVFNGHRRMTLHLQEALIELLERKKATARKLDSFTGKE